MVADIRAEAGAAAAEEASAAMAAPVVHRSRRIPAAFQAALGVLTWRLPGVRPFPICHGIISAVASGWGIDTIRIRRAGRQLEAARFTNYWEMLARQITKASVAPEVVQEATYGWVRSEGA